jgi:hypothetical protein
VRTHLLWRSPVPRPCHLQPVSTCHSDLSLPCPSFGTIPSLPLDRQVDDFSCIMFCKDTECSVSHSVSTVTQPTAPESVSADTANVLTIMTKIGGSLGCSGGLSPSFRYQISISRECGAYRALGVAPTGLGLQSQQKYCGYHFLLRTQDF